MLSKSHLKLINSLKQKKIRYQQQLFIAEGKKIISELLDSQYELHMLYTTTLEFDVSDDLYSIITPNELKKISYLKTPNIALGLFKLKDMPLIGRAGLKVALDDIRDPGNLGTIIRLCDWFGVSDLICNENSVDCYNPKVIQATMGSIARVNVHYIDLQAYLEKSEQLTYGAFMDGESIYEMNLSNDSILVLGNESKGISTKIAKHIDTSISIPPFGDKLETESLNVANATAILLNECRRSSTET